MKTMLSNPFYIIVIIMLFSCSEDGDPIDDSDQNGNTTYFEKSNQTLGNTRTFGMATGDVDLDGDQDVMLANYISASKLWINNGDGTFTISSQSFNSSVTHDAGIADLNGDNYPDIILISHANTNKIYLNNSDLTYTESNENIGGGSSENPDDIFTGDFDNDNDVDLFIYNFSSADKLWLNNGDGTFIVSSDIIGSSDAKGYQLADFNGDNYLDLFILMRGLPNQIWLNDQTGTFINSGYTFGSSGDDADVIDFDKDGDKDLIISDNGGVTFWLNENNTGTFIQGYRINEEAIYCKAFDVDLDGDYDIITMHPSNGNKLWINDGSNSFQANGNVLGTNMSFCMEKVDIENDGDMDIVFGQMEGTGGNAVYINKSIDSN